MEASRLCAVGCSCKQRQVCYSMHHCGLHCRPAKSQSKPSEGTCHMIAITSAPMEAIHHTPALPWRPNITHLRSHGGHTSHTCAPMEAKHHTPALPWRPNITHLRSHGGQTSHTCAPMEAKHHTPALPGGQCCLAPRCCPIAHMPCPAAGACRWWAACPWPTQIR